ncbi:MAG: SDR family oxidoreductase [Caldilineaceae bacterium]|nr:SDR family oxidoreductase [Caldilineaceae bacterium]
MQDLFALHGKVSLVTGANGGIGRSIALGYKAMGATVVASGRNPKKNAAVAKELGDGHEVIALDVRDEEAVNQAVASIVKKHGRLDILVNNAGIARRTNILDMDTEDWHSVIDTHLNGGFYCAKAAAKAMVDAGNGGKIINIGSMYSLLGPPNVTNYAAAKTGILGLTRGLAVELAVHNIQVNALLPGWHKTDMNRELLDGPLGEEIRHKTPARRLGTADDLAGAAIFLASDAGQFVTGTTLVVDGGYSIMDRQWAD